MHRKSIVACSYAGDGYPSISDIAKFFKAQFRDTLICRPKLSHALKKGQKKEVLIIGIPK
jgi:hypothetical protein